jgi:pimeloyl-ACP methyl ester carboxylesterase
MLEKRRISLGGQTIDVREKTTPMGKAFVFIHGIGVSGRYFYPLAKELSSDNSVYILDLPGYGKTPKPPKPLNVKMLARLVEQFIEQHAIDEPVLVGQSMGCQIAVHVANSNPGKYRNIILIGPTVDRHERNRFMQGLRLLQDTSMEPAHLNKIIFSDYIRMGVRRYLKTSSFMLADCIEKSLKKYTGKALIVRGENDPISSSKWCRYITDIAPHGCFCEVKGAAHVAQYTKPKEVGEICRKFLIK